jgi:5-methylthioadenosine/S-adenosylhomocysteine deaminase
MSILIKDVLLGNKITHVYIEGNLIKEIGQKLEAEYVIDGCNKAIIPGLVNSHTHAAMSLFRGYADDTELHEWLQEKIWPVESRLTAEDVYWGTRLACLEMIKSGTTCFNDMYWHAEAVAKAVYESGIRGIISHVFIDRFNPERSKEQIRYTKRVIRRIKEFVDNRIIPALGPHAIYTVSRESLEWIKEYADKNQLLIHFHLAETEKEIKDCIKQHGKHPVPYLEDIGFLSENLIACHCVWLNQKDINTLARYNVKIVHCPTSNMKLAIGNVLNYSGMKKLMVSLGTDGCASNNNLDMFEEMKFATLLQKYHTKNQTIMPAHDVFNMATINGAKTLGINAGIIEPGKLADIVLIDLKEPELTPNHNLVSNLVYSANGSCVDTVICNGKILMQNKKIKDEAKILEKANQVTRKLFKV